MSLTVYKDTNLTDQVSDEDDFGNPDQEDDIDGDSGEIRVDPLFIAMEQTTLSAGINDSTGTIPLTVPRFTITNPNLNVIVIVTGGVGEKIKIGAGGGTNTLTGCERGYRETDPASHDQGDPVILCYDVTLAKIESLDNDTPPDEADWLDYCLDSGGSPDGNYANPLSLGTMAYNEKKAIHRRATVPASQSPDIKTDLLHKPNGSLKEHKFA